ncbi:nitrite reductase small subunit NirD [Terrabacter sp. 2RAF25]|uniref:nitrite reductase small subunit NirD n=1 Tax=Terrabacter sp. 2RAF25 TaxID=3232998 RepID=UPI003F9B8F9C
MTTLTTAPEVTAGGTDTAADCPVRTVVRPGIVPSPGAKQWVPACDVQRLVPGRGVAVLLPGSAQAALFLLPNGMIYAVDNLDPYAGAAVLSRGLTGDRGGEPTVASPLLKQVFSLRTGAALDDDETALPTYAVRVQHGIVHVGLPLP